MYLIVYLQSDNETGYTFEGFIIQARVVADDSPVGYFIDNSTEYQPQCDNNVSTHKCYSDVYVHNFMLICMHICRQLLLIQMTEIKNL